MIGRAWRSTQRKRFTPVDDPMVNHHLARRTPRVGAVRPVQGHAQGFVDRGVRPLEQLAPLRIRRARRWLAIECQHVEHGERDGNLALGALSVGRSRPLVGLRVADERENERNDEDHE
jgi:hypothetical protein